MISQLLDRLRFAIERWMQRGAIHQMMAMAGVIFAVAVVAGLIVFVSGRMLSLPDAVWWAFLRLTDPGYLGDDEGAFLRSIATVVTVLGYVLFMGSLIAIMTQWLRQRMQKLERGLTPIALNDHLLILGWTSRTAAIVRELLLSQERVERFLEIRRTRRLRIVILVEELDAEFSVELRDQLAPHWDDRKIILRLGTPLRAEHLRRVNAWSAAAILIPGADFGPHGFEVMDARTVKTLLSLADSGENGRGLPHVVAEVFHENHANIAARAYRGQLDVLSSDAIISRLIAQNVRHPGLSFVYSELLTYTEGSEFYVRRCPELVDTEFGAIRPAFARSVVLGVVRPDGEGLRAYLNPDPHFRLQADDRFILIAESYEATVPAEWTRQGPLTSFRPPPSSPPPRPSRRVLVLGWSRKAPALLREFEHSPRERYAVDVVSIIPAVERERLTERYGTAFHRLEVRHLEADHTATEELERIHPEAYDSVVFLAVDWLSSDEESDARTVLGYLVYRSLTTGAAHHPKAVIELLDPDNARLFDGRDGEVIVSPVILSHMMAHVALRRELHVVFDELFGPGGAEIYFRSAAAYELCNERLSFSAVQERVAAFGEVALGVRLGSEVETRNGGIVMNPPRNDTWHLTERDQIVLLSTPSR